MNKITNPALAAIMAVCALLLGIGNLAIVNALQPHYLNNAIIYFVCGIAVAAAVFFCGTKRLLDIAPYVTAIMLLLLLLTPVFGYNISGATRWLRIYNFSLAPAMPAMPVLCLFWAYVKEKSSGKISRTQWTILATVTLSAAVLIAFEPFIQMGFFVIVLGFIMLYLIGFNRKILSIVSISSVIGFAVIVLTFFKTRPMAQYVQLLRRFVEYVELPYHYWICLKTLQYSVFIGKCQFPPEISKFNHIPYATFDSALVAGCGEFGYLFLITALLLAFIMILCGAVIASRCAATSSLRLLAGGLTAAIAMPALFNTLMMFGLTPMCSIAFPFLSCGGTAMISNALALGGIMAVCRKNSSAE
ncbi:MAG: FtsW/RodA/SpoVE family cell cycle protein [Lentisphaeria bacterium]|nr:FtsW/RodA/SpoVE family cell cycle protein [Lentisphaeria bacterium]